jgi:hypothetical protein
MQKPPLVVIGVLGLLVVVMFFWKGCAVANVQKQVEAERVALAEKQRQLEEKLRAEMDLRVEETLKLMGVPLGWAVRTEAISDDSSQIEDYAHTLLKQPRIERVVWFGQNDVAAISTDRKLQGKPAAEIAGDLTSNNGITLERQDSGDYLLMIPILGYNERLGSLLVTIDGD